MTFPELDGKMKFFWMAVAVIAAMPWSIIMVLIYKESIDEWFGGVNISPWWSIAICLVISYCSFRATKFRLFKRKW